MNFHTETLKDNAVISGREQFMKQTPPKKLFIAEAIVADAGVHRKTE